jgi:integrase/recombinase XerD
VEQESRVDRVGRQREQEHSARALVQREVNDWLRRENGLTNKTYINAVLRVGKMVRDLAHVSDGQANEVVQRLREKGYRQNTIASTVAALSSLTNHLRRAGLASENPWSRLKGVRPKPKTAERILTPDEVRAMVTAADTLRDKTFIRFCYYTALRVSAAVSVRWRDIRRALGGQYFATVTEKGGETRTVEVPAFVCRDMTRMTRRRINPEDRIFPFSDRRARQIVSRLAKKAGIEGNISAHWLRHSHATHKMEGGANIKQVQDSLGHKSIQTTEKYLHISPEDRGSEFLPEV